jgi:hypothetical protein
VLRRLQEQNAISSMGLKLCDGFVTVWGARRSAAGTSVVWPFVFLLFCKLLALSYSCRRLMSDQLCFHSKAKLLSGAWLATRKRVEWKGPI